MDVFAEGSERPGGGAEETPVRKSGGKKTPAFPGAGRGSKSKKGPPKPAAKPKPKAVKPKPVVKPKKVKNTTTPIKLNPPKKPESAKLIAKRKRMIEAAIQQFAPSDV